MVSEKTLESPLDCKEIQPVHPKGDQSWMFIRRTDVEAETPTLWPPDAKNWLIWKDPDAGKDWRQKEKRMTEDEMVKWHHQIDSHKFEQASGVGDGQGSLVCCSPWGHRESDKTEWLNWIELRYRCCNHVRWGLVTLGIAFTYGIYSWLAENSQYLELLPIWYSVLFPYNNYGCIFFHKSEPVVFNSEK